MIHFSYTRQYDGQFYKTGSFNNSDWVTLCGAEVDHDTDMKDGKLCEECIKVMWKEQHRRNMLMPEIKKARKRLRKNGKAEAPKAEAPKEPNFEPSWLYLSHYLEASE